MCKTFNYTYHVYEKLCEKLCSKLYLTVKSNRQYCCIWKCVIKCLLPITLQLILPFPLPLALVHWMICAFFSSQQFSENQVPVEIKAICSSNYSSSKYEDIPWSIHTLWNRYIHLIRRVDQEKVRIKIWLCALCSHLPTHWLNTHQLLLLKFSAGCSCYHFPSACSHWFEVQ